MAGEGQPDANAIAGIALMALAQFAPTALF